MKSGSKVKIEFMDDGSIKINASEAIGTEAELKEDLEALAKELGGVLIVEKHVHKHGHSHTHDDRLHHKH